MADVFSKKKRSQVMAAVRSTGNKLTEVKLAAVLRRNGMKGWRRHLPLPGKPDFAFPKERVAIFVDGCFWHGCPRHLRMPADNRGYWRSKIHRNISRDRSAKRVLGQEGWCVLRVWEHELQNEELVLRRLDFAFKKAAANQHPRLRMRNGKPRS